MRYFFSFSGRRRGPFRWVLLVMAVVGWVPGATATAHSKPAGAVAVLTRHPNASAGLRLRYGGVHVDALTYHYDNGRSGWNAAETELTPATVGSSNFGLLQTLAVDGDVMAQPVLISNIVLPDQSVHDVLVVATEHNSVYAFDAQDYDLLWHTQLGAPQNAADVGCGEGTEEYGIASTPVIVRTGAGAATLYAVAATEPAPNEFRTQIHALSLATGADVVEPVEVAASAVLSDSTVLQYDPKNQWSRAGLAFANNSLYVAMSSHCDHAAATVSGWMLRYDRSLSPKGAFHTIDTPVGWALATIWMSGYAPAVDSEGNVYAVTGNGNFSRGGKDWGESVIKLPPNLAHVRDYFTPADYNPLNDGDLDFGAGGVMLIPAQPDSPAPPMAVAMGKDAMLYLLDPAHLGHKHSGDEGALQAMRVGARGAGVLGGPAYYGSPDGGRIYYQRDADVLRSYAVSAGAKPTLTSVARGQGISNHGGAIPIVSSNGAAAGTALVWVIQRGSVLRLEAYDALKLGPPLFAADAGNWPNTTCSALVTPLQANGRVYVPANKTVTVFGLTPRDGH